MTCDKELIRQVVLRALVAGGEPLRGQRGELTFDLFERIGMQAHLSGDRSLLKMRGMSRAMPIFRSWLEGVPEGGCELMFEQMSWEDATWEIYNSYDEGYWTERGVDVQVYCTCGRIAGVAWRYEGTWGALLRLVTGG